MNIIRNTMYTPKFVIMTLQENFSYGGFLLVVIQA